MFNIGGNSLIPILLLEDIMWYNSRNLSVFKKFIFLFLLFFPCILFAQIPNIISYQGVLTDNNGNIVPDGSYNIKFELFSVNSGGTALWSGTQTVPVTKGHFNVLLGTVNALNLSFDVPYWLEITVNGTTLTPRIELSSSAYSFNTSRIQGKPISSTVPDSGQVLQWNGSEWKPGTVPKDSLDETAGGDLTGTFPNPIVAKIQGNPVSSTSPTSGQVLQWNGSAWTPGAVSVGSISGTAGGDLSGSYPNPIVSKIQGNPVSSNAPVSGQVLKWNGSEWTPGTDISSTGSSPWVINSSDIYYNLGKVIVGSNSSQGSISLEADNKYTNGTAIAGYDNTQSTTGVGVFGYSNSLAAIYGNGSNGQYAGYFKGNVLINGKTLIGTQTSSGSIGLESDNPFNNGVAIAGYSNNTQGSGVFGYSNGGGYGIFGRGDGGADAGYFIGNVHVQGTLSKSGGSFEIDDPLDPANKILRHSFVESPDMMDVYNGNITTDASGTAVVQLPDYFDALNMDFRYQLTVIGQFAQAIVSQEIQNNQFTIKTDKPNVKVSWQVTGIRNDPWAKKHRIVVEQEKTSQTKGYYLNPRAYGLPETRSLVYSLHPKLMKQIEAESKHNEFNKVN